MPYNEKIDARITKIVSRMMRAATGQESSARFVI
jgi:hypothetical protein